MQSDLIGPPTTGEFGIVAFCAKCAAEFNSRIIAIDGKEILRSRYCEPCVDEHNKSLRKMGRSESTRVEKWTAICPPVYRDTDLTRMRKDWSQKGVKCVFPQGIEFFSHFQANDGSRGVGITGDSRIGKTRLMFRLLEGMFLAGKNVTYTYAPDFSDNYAALMSESAAKGSNYLERIIASDIWFLDDLGKGRLSEASQRALLRVIEKRTNSLRAIFVTSNHHGKVLIEKMRYDDGRESEYAEPMIERLREFCDFYKLERKKD